MAIIGIRISNNEKQRIMQYAVANRQSISAFVKSTLFEKLDDELDVQLVQEYSESPPEEKETISFAEAKRIWGVK
jgi:hypothetical protein